MRNLGVRWASSLLVFVAMIIGVILFGSTAEGSAKEADMLGSLNTKSNPKDKFYQRSLRAESDMVEIWWHHVE